MDHYTQSDTQVLQTTDYSQFKHLQGNRHLDKAKIRRIKESVENGLDFFKFCPIMVNQDGFIIDGQHRFEVCRTMDLPIFFVIVPKFSLRQIAEMNNNTSKWKDRDFLNCYVDIGIEHYKTLKNFINTFEINIGIACSLLDSGKVKQSGVMDDFRDGLFHVNKFQEATKFMRVIELFKDLCPCYKSRNFMQAVEILMQSAEFSLDDFLAKLRSSNLVIEQKGSPKEYLTHMEDLFNYHNSKRRRIY